MNRKQQASRIEELTELLISKTQDIPEEVQRAFTKRAVEDARKLLSGNDIALDTLSYSLYRAYILGAALYDNDNLINKFEENKKIEQEVKPTALKAVKKSSNKNSKIISFPKASFNV